MTFRHISLIRWQPSSDQAARDAVLDALRGLPAQIDTIRSYVLGTDARINEGNFDLAIVADFDDEAGYLAYRDHPVHKQLLAERVAPIMQDRAAVQHRLT